MTKTVRSFVKALCDIWYEQHKKNNLSFAESALDNLVHDFIDRFENIPPLLNASMER